MGKPIKTTPVVTATMRVLRLPPKPGHCAVCATEHEPHFPHNQQSLYYQMCFHEDNGRWPTWEDALAHCTAEMKAFWEEELRARGAWSDNSGGDTSGADNSGGEVKK